MQLRILIFFFSLFLIVGSAEAQNKKRSRQMRKKSTKMANFKGSVQTFANKRYLTLGLSVNSLNYFGDLAPKSNWGSTDITFTRPGISVFTDYKLTPRIWVRGELLFGVLRGSDFESADPNDQDAKFRYIRNQHFRNRIQELSVVGYIELFENQGTFLTRYLWNPYFFLGVGIMHHNPQALVPEQDFVNPGGGAPLNAGEWIDLRPLGTEGQYVDGLDVEPYSLWQVTVPFGIGMNYKLSTNLDIGVEVGFRYLFTDYIDDVSGDYINPWLFDESNLSPEEADLARVMANRTMETVDAVSGEERSPELIVPTVTRTSPDGVTYNLVNGFGYEGKDQMRGGKADNDIFMVFSVKVKYLLAGSFRNARFR